MIASKKISKCKIMLQTKHPFWAYLLLRMRTFEDVDNKLPAYAGMGVNAHGDVTYKTEFVDKLDEHELCFVLAHEINHVIFEHLIRIDNRNMLIWNLATDIVINNLLINNNFKAPDGVLKPKYGEIEVFGNKITDIDSKVSEEIYNELIKGKSSPENNTGQFDKHNYEKLTDDQKTKLRNKIKDNLVSASIYAKSRGIVPYGMESFIDKLVNPKLNWRQLVKRYILAHIPYDTSFLNRNKKFPHVILPGPLKENIDIVVAIDTSGSIDDKELNQFFSECKSIISSHKNVKMTLIQCDCRIQDVQDIRSMNKLDIKIKGRGGTSHKPVVDYVNKNLPNARLLVALTDGASDIEICFFKLRCDKIIVLNSDYGGLEKCGKVVKI